MDVLNTDVFMMVIDGHETLLCLSARSSINYLNAITAKSTITTRSSSASRLWYQTHIGR